MRIYITGQDFELMDIYGQIPSIGGIATVVRRDHLLTGAKTYYFAGAAGAAGNIDPSIKLYHGWRGTTNNWHSDAIGLRRIEDIKRCKNGNYCIILSKDLAPDMA